MKPRRYSVNQPRCAEDAEKHENGSAEAEQGRDGASSFAGFLFITTREQLGINRDERGGEYAFAEKILQEIGNAEGGFENIRSVGIAKIVREDTIADQAGYAAEENARRH